MPDNEVVERAVTLVSYYGIQEMLELAFPVVAGSMGLLNARGLALGQITAMLKEVDRKMNLLMQSDTKTAGVRLNDFSGCSRSASSGRPTTP